MNKIRTLPVIIAACAVLLTLTGCAREYSKSEALSTTNAVLELTDPNLFKNSDFGYVNDSGDVVPLTECGRPSMFDQRYCETLNGAYHFQYSRGKSGVYNASLTVDGRKIELTCNIDTDDFWNGNEVCVPVK